ncbi:MAG: GFA family protein [Sphingopyxis sp.]|nr:GFA family protein [Sphingopyxis sp.]
MGSTGRCSCGAVEVRIDAEPLAVRQCWCRRCQKIAAGGPTHNAIFPTDSIVADGVTASDSYVADSGNTLTRSHCPACGTPIFSASSARPQLRVVRLGVLDQPHGLKPTAVIWTSEAPEWAIFDPSTEQFAGQPPAPTPQS